MPTVKEIQKKVKELEDAKRFGHDLERKVLWLGEEYGELIHAFKHNDRDKMIEETIDILHFVGSILSALDADGDAEFEKKLAINWKREPVNDKGEFHFDR